MEGYVAWVVVIGGTLAGAYVLYKLGIKAWSKFKQIKNG